MNCTTYIFGNLKQGYSQYPDDYAKGVFEKMLMHCEDTTQIVTHRKNDLMYYAYVRKCPSNNTVIGLCIVFNSLMMEDTSVLFSLFEDVVGKISADGDVLTFSNDGDIIPAVDKLEESVQGQIERVRAYLLEKAVHLEENCVKLPPVSYGVDAETIKRFSYDDKADDIAQASCAYSYTYIGKNKDFDNEAVLQNRELVKEVNVERAKAEEQYKEVVFSHRSRSASVGAVLAVVFFIVGYLIFANPYNILKDELSRLEVTLKDVTTYKENTEQSLKARTASLQKLKESYQAELKKIEKKVPLLIREVKIGNRDGEGKTQTNFGETIYSSSSMYITPQLEIYGLKNCTAEIDVKIYDAYGIMLCSPSSPIDFSDTETILVKKGVNKTYTLGGWGSGNRGHWRSGKYKFEFWYKGICLGKHYFTIN